MTREPYPWPPAHPAAQSGWQGVDAAASLEDWLDTQILTGLLTPTQARRYLPDYDPARRIGWLTAWDDTTDTRTDTAAATPTKGGDH
jgi:hypothetical protein